MKQTKRKVLTGEASWLIGMFGMALGVALISSSQFGYSMIAAPVYLIFAKLNLFSFGTVEYLFQGLLLFIMCLLVQRFYLRYLCSFVTAVIYGLLFDLMLFFVSFLPADLIAMRILCFILGEFCIGVAVVMFIHTDMAPEVYELFVKELVDRYHLDFGRTKLIYDCVLLLLSFVLSISLFGFGVFSDFSFAALGKAVVDGYILEGIGVGTLISALINGPMISGIDRFLSARISFSGAKGIGKLLRYDAGSKRKDT